MALENFQFGKKQIIIAVAIFLATLAWAIALGLTGITVNDLFTFKIGIVAEKVLSLNTALFFFLLPLPAAIMASLAGREDKATLMILSMVSSLLALITAMAAFPGVQGFWILGIFYIIAVPLVIETCFMKKEEFKKWVPQRVPISGMRRAIMVLSIGFVALSALTIMPQQEQYVEKFEDFIADFASLATGEMSKDTIPEEATSLLVNSQIATVNQLLDNAAFEKLREKQDTDVMAFVLLADNAKKYLESDEYRALIEQQFTKTTSNVVNRLDVIGLIKKQFPLFELLETYLWLFHALTVVGIFSLAAGIICKPMAAVYGTIAELAVPKERPQEGWERQAKSAAQKSPTESN